MTRSDLEGKRIRTLEGYGPDLVRPLGSGRAFPADRGSSQTHAVPAGFEEEGTRTGAGLSRLLGEAASVGGVRANSARTGAPTSGTNPLTPRDVLPATRWGPEVLPARAPDPRPARGQSTAQWDFKRGGAD